MSKVLAIPDLHFPFHHAKTFSFLLNVKKRFDPDQIVCLGDEADMHAFSTKFSSNPDGFSAGHELEEAIKYLKCLYEIFPKVKVCESNHTVRPYKKAFDFGLPSRFLKGYRELLEAPVGWHWKDRWEIDGVIYEHGEGLSGSAAQVKSVRENMKSTVFGHIHSFAGVQYVATNDKTLFGFNAGCLIDRNAYAFAYGAKIRNKPILGCGIIDDGVPTFIPLQE